MTKSDLEKEYRDLEYFHIETFKGLKYPDGDSVLDLTPFASSYNSACSYQYSESLWRVITKNRDLYLKKYESSETTWCGGIKTSTISGSIRTQLQQLKIEIKDILFLVNERSNSEGYERITIFEN